MRLYRPGGRGRPRASAYDREDRPDRSPRTFIGRIVPNSGRPVQRAPSSPVTGIEETADDGVGFRSPRGSAWPTTSPASSRSIVRGGFGIFYDRPQGNLVFDLIKNPPGISVRAVDLGALRRTSTPATAPHCAPSDLTPTQYDWKVPKVYDWNVGVQAKLPGA